MLKLTFHQMVRVVLDKLGGHGLPTSDVFHRDLCRVDSVGSMNITRLYGFLLRARVISQQRAVV